MTRKPITHGTVSGYVRRCRCKKCIEAARSYQKNLSAQKRKIGYCYHCHAKRRFGKSINCLKCLYYNRNWKARKFGRAEISLEEYVQYKIKKTNRFLSLQAVDE